MKPVIVVMLVVGLVVAIGCSQPVPPAPPKPDLRFTVAWPGEPHEMGPGNVGDDSWQYVATYVDKERHLHYSASVTELGAASANMPPQERLTYFKAGLQS